MCFHLQISCDSAPHIFFMMPWVKMSLLQSFELHGFPCGSVGKEYTCNVGRPVFNPWVGKILYRREKLSAPVFWPGEFHGLYGPWGCKGSDRTEQLSLSLSFMAGGKPKRSNM